MQIKKIIDKLVNVEVYSIFFTGGEPSIRKDLGAIAYRVLRLMPNKPELLDQVLEEEESKWLIEELDKVRHEKKIEIEVHVPPGCFHTRYFNPLLFPKFSHAYTSICTACKASMAILSNGDVVPCIELKEIKLGNILHQDIEEIWNSEKCKEMRNLTPSTYTGLCRICPLSYVCYSTSCLAYRFNSSLYAALCFYSSPNPLP
jgi:radical SAM protein with 4Fe4S-binding SPASM domain